jgi:hypothetical protein
MNNGLNIGQCHITGTAFAFGSNDVIPVIDSDLSKPELRRFKINAFDKKKILKSIPIIVEVRGRLPENVTIEHGKPIGLGNCKLSVSLNKRTDESELTIFARAEDCFTPSSWSDDK